MCDPTFSHIVDAEKLRRALDQAIKQLDGLSNSHTFFAGSTVYAEILNRYPVLAFSPNLKESQSLPQNVVVDYDPNKQKCTIITCKEAKHGRA